MPVNITEVPDYDTPIAVPQDGDPLNAASVTDVLTGFQALADRTANLNTRLLTVQNRFEDGLYDSPGIMSSSDGVHLFIGSIVSFDIQGVHFGAQPDVPAFAPSGLSSNQWFNVYAFNNSGAVGYMVSTGLPASNRRFKFGDASKVYVGSIYVDGSGNIRPFRKTGNKYLWRMSLISEDMRVDAANFTAPGPTTATLANLISPQAAIASCSVNVFSTVASKTAVIRVRTEGTDAGTAEFVLSQNSPQVNLSAVTSRDFEVDATQNLAIEIAGDTSGGNIPTGAVTVVGYYE